MWTRFIFEQSNFGVQLLAAFSFLTVAWLYIDTLRLRMTKSVFFLAFGFLAVGVSYGMQAPIVGSLAADSAIHFMEIIIICLRSLGYMGIAVGTLIEPLTIRPREDHGSTYALGAPFPTVLTAVAAPIAAACAAWGYIRRSSVGLEVHLRPVGIALFWFAGAELLHVWTFLGNSSIPWVVRSAALYGPVWIVEHCFTVIGAVILLRWVFSYLLKQFHTQLILYIQSTVLVSFFLISFVFSLIVASSTRDAVVTQFGRSAGVVTYAIGATQGRVLAELETLGRDPAVITGATAGRAVSFSRLIESILVARSLSTLRVLDASGTVIAAGENHERVGSSMANDVMVIKARVGTSASAVIHEAGVGTDVVRIAAAVPVKNPDGTVIGIVYGTADLDRSWLDGLKKSTGMEAFILRDDVVEVATSELTIPAGARVSRMNRTRGGNQSELVAFMLSEQSYTGGAVDLQGVDGIPVATLIIAEPDTNYYAGVSRALMLTFAVTVIFAFLSTIPAAYIASSVVKQL
jgi:hypothetical protein